MSDNRECRLAARPVGEIKESDFEFVTNGVAEPDANEFVVKTTHLSIDPAMRGWMNAGRSYFPPVEIGEVMRAMAVGEVIASRNPSFAVGDRVHGTFGVQEYAVSDGSDAYRVDISGDLTPAAYLGALGTTGITAYFGLLEVGRLQEGETVLVSGAAGAVGTIVGQIAKISGARVVGIAGGPEKCRLLTEDLGFDAAIDYKADDFHKQLRASTGDYVDVFFDNVGGEILDLGLTRLRHGARVVICGAISQYNNTQAMAGPSNYMSLLVNRASMTGFVVFDYADRYPEAIAAMSTWLSEGRLHSVEDTVRGDIEMFPAMLARLFSGQNTGKLVLELDRAG